MWLVSLDSAPLTANQSTNSAIVDNKLSPTGHFTTVIATLANKRKDTQNQTHIIPGRASSAFTKIEAENHNRSGCAKVDGCASNFASCIAKTGEVVDATLGITHWD